MNPWGNLQGENATEEGQTGWKVGSGSDFSLRYRDTPFFGMSRIYTNIYTSIFRLLTSSSTAQRDRSTFRLLRRLFTTRVFLRLCERENIGLLRTSPSLRTTKRTDGRTDRGDEGGRPARTHLICQALARPIEEGAFLCSIKCTFISLDRCDCTFFAPSATIFD